MSKKNIIIIAVVLLLAASGFFAYKSGFFTPLLRRGGGIFGDKLTPEKLLVFEIKNPDLSPEIKNYYQGRFNAIKTALNQKSDDINQWLALGLLKKAAADYEGARDIMLYINQQWPKDSTAYANLADLYANFLNESEQGLAAIQKAIELMPKEINYRLALADIYRYKFPEKTGMYEKTIRDALQILPNDTNLIAPLAAYYRDTGQTQKAIEWYEKFVQLAPENEMAKEDLEELKKTQ